MKRTHSLRAEIAIGATALILSVIIPASATQYLVMPDGSGDFPTIAAAVAAASSGDTIALGDGIFRGAGNRNIDYSGKAIAIISVGGEPAACVIDCELAGRGFAFMSDEGPASILEGVTITNGYADPGGAVRCWPGSSPTIRHCIFSHCESQMIGGAIASVGLATAPTIEDCSFVDNVATFGGAIMCWVDTTPTITNCTFTGNYAWVGGGLDIADRAAPTIDRCIFAANSAERGGAITSEADASAVVRRCTFAANMAADAGAGVRCEDYGSIQIENTIIAFSERGEAVSVQAGSAASLSCCDLFGNSGGDWTGAIAWQYGLYGNFASDPFFLRDGGVEEYYLLWDFSPCASEHQPSCAQIGACPIGRDGILLRPDGSGEFTSIQAAVDAAPAGAFICLDAGTYVGLGNREIDLRGKPFELRSVALDPATCVIDCQETARGFVCRSGEGPETVLHGLSIKNGHADIGGAILCDGASPALRQCILSHCLASIAGGGVFCRASAPTIVNCTVAENAAPDGGGLFCSESSAPTLENALIVFSTDGEALGCDVSSTADLACCDLYGNADGDWVGAIAPQYANNGNISADPLFCASGDYRLSEGSPCAPFSPFNPECDLVGALPVGCRGVYAVTPDGSGDFASIQAAIDGVENGAVIELADGVFSGAGNRDIDFRGKAITVRSASGRPGACVIDCGGAGRGFVFQTHELATSILEGVVVTGGVQTSGGAIACLSGGSPTIQNCTLYGNTGSSQGGAISINAAMPHIIGCTIAYNSSSNGAGIASMNGTGTVIDNTILAFGTGSAAVFCYGGDPPLFSCCDIYGNSGGDWTGAIATQYGIRGNISLDPLFRNPEEGDFALQEDSPCAPFSPPNPECDLIGAWPVADEQSVDGAPGDEQARLFAIRPSPSSPPITIAFSLPADLAGTRFALMIYDAGGRVVKTFREPDLPVGFGAVSWDGANSTGMRVPAGVYFVRLEADGGQQVCSRLVIVR